MKSITIRFPLDIVRLIKDSSEIERRSFGNMAVKIIEDHFLREEIQENYKKTIPSQIQG